MIKWNTETLPKSEIKGEACNPYYLVRLAEYEAKKAMFIDGEWWTSYIEKLMVDVEGWVEIK